MKCNFYRINPPAEAKAASDFRQDGDIIEIGGNAEGVRMCAAVGRGVFHPNYCSAAANPSAIALAKLLRKHDDHLDCRARRELAIHIEKCAVAADVARP